MFILRSCIWISGLHTLYMYSLWAAAESRVVVVNIDSSELAMEASPTSMPVTTICLPTNSGGGAVPHTKTFDNAVSVMSRVAGLGITSHTARLAYINALTIFVDCSTSVLGTCTIGFVGAQLVP